MEREHSIIPTMSSDYLKYFTLDKANLKARCKLCSDQTKNIFSFSKSSKTNLKTHLASVHTEDIKKIEQEEKKNNPFLICSLSSEEQSRITDAVVDFVIEADEPISLPEKPAFRKLMKKVKPSWKPICKKTCRAKILQKGKPFVYNHTQYKAKYGKPSGTVDLWTSRRRQGYMAVTLHLQNRHRSFPKVLDVRYIPSPHNAANIATCYHSILGEYGLNPDDLFKVVSDNASTMKKAFKVSLWEAEDPAIQTDQEQQVQENEFEPNIDENEEFQDLIVNFVEIFREQYRRPCNIHTLQLFVKDIISALPARHKQVLARAKVACRKQHQSVHLSEATDFTLPAHCETRWNGQLKLLAKIEQHFDDVLDKIGTFMAADRSYVSGLCWLLSPMQRMTSRIEGDHVATIHHVIPNLCGIERHLLSIPKQSSSFNFSQNFCDETLKLLEKRFGFVVEDEHLLAAAVLSAHGLKWVTNAPRQALLFGSYDQILQLVKKYIHQQILAIPAEDLPQCENMASEALNKIDDDFGYEQVQTQTTISTWEQELSDHLLRVAAMTADVDPIAYWKSQPPSALTVVAIQILNVTASSAPVERVFSLCGNICTDTRTRMGPDLLSALVRAKFNSYNENHMLDC